MVDVARRQAARRLSQLLDRSGVSGAATRARQVLGSVRRLLPGRDKPRRR